MSSDLSLTTEYNGKLFVEYVKPPPSVQNNFTKAR